MVLGVGRWLAVAAVLIGTASAASAQDAVSLETAKQRYSYGVGLRVADMLISQGLEDLDAEALALALKDRYAGAPSRVALEDLIAAETTYQEDAAVAEREAAERNAEEGRAFLASNRNEDGVTALDSGLQYRVVVPGEGASPGPADTVVVHYRGMLLDGREFDSSYARGQPAEFPVGGVIAGWQEAIQLMVPGARWEVWIPGELAYGERGTPGIIGPNHTLHFEIELIAVK